MELVEDNPQSIILHILQNVIYQNRDLKGQQFERRIRTNDCMFEDIKTSNFFLNRGILYR